MTIKIIGMGLCVLALTLTLTLTLAGCDASVVDRIPVSRTTHFEDGVFEADLELMDNFDQPTSTFQLNEEIYLSFKIKNLSNTTQTLRFGNTQRVKGVFFKDENREIVFDFDSRYSYAQVLGEVTIESGETLTYELQLSATDIGRGKFTVVAAIAFLDIDNTSLMDDKNSQFESEFQFEIL